jgi:Zn-dependent M28 family amino/carboxypeptidase
MKSSAIEAIVALGVAVFIVLGLTSIGMKRMVQGAGSRRAVAEKGKSPFDGQRAFGDLRTVVGFGPRVSGSDALARTREYIEGELKKAGLTVRQHAFDADTPIGKVKMVNVAGIVAGSRPDVIMITNHYETKQFSDFTFVGANDGGSTTAWMIEMARTLGPKREGMSVWLCFFDGEEAFKQWSETDSLYGSRAFVKQLQEEGTLSRVRAEINVDMIGDCYLGIKRDRGAPIWLTRAIWSTARDLGYGAHFLPFAHDVADDHLPFRRAGIPAADLIDFTYGESVSEHSRNWHTANDTLERVCPDSLQVVGDVIYHALPKIEAAVKAGS